MTSARSKGFTLIELMIVIAIIAIIAAIAIPNLIAARLASNETAAVATLRIVLSAQAQFQQSAKADTDGDGSGEYGGFLELSGGGVGRMAAVLNPPVLSGAFRTLNAQGCVSRSGYFFKVYLPGAGGVGVSEPQTGYVVASGVNPDLAETMWCTYAWPVAYGQAGNRTFFTNQAGDLVSTESAAYSTSTGAPPAGAAFQGGGATVITGAVAIGVLGQDANLWKQVN